MTDPQDYDVDLDDVPRNELGEIDPMYPVVADALGKWATHMMNGAGSTIGSHGVGTFLDDLAAEGYRVTAIDPGPCLHELLGPPEE